MAKFNSKQFYNLQAFRGMGAAQGVDFPVSGSINQNPALKGSTGDTFYKTLSGSYDLVQSDDVVVAAWAVPGHYPSVHGKWIPIDPEDIELGHTSRGYARINRGTLTGYQVTLLVMKVNDTQPDGTER
jgi:hypothetical protein